MLRRDVREQAAFWRRDRQRAGPIGSVFVRCAAHASLNCPVYIGAPSRRLLFGRLVCSPFARLSPQPSSRKLILALVLPVRAGTACNEASREACNMRGWSGGSPALSVSRSILPPFAGQASRSDMVDRHATLPGNMDFDFISVTPCAVSELSSLAAFSDGGNEDVAAADGGRAETGTHEVTRHPLFWFENDIINVQVRLQTT
jgi:hypothetical protein